MPLIDNYIYKRKVLSIIFILLTITGIVFFFYQSKKLQVNLDEKISYVSNIINKDFQVKIKDTQNDYIKRVDEMLSIDGVTEAFASEDREKLYMLIKDTYKEYKRYDKFLKIMTFRLKDGSTFLRVHKPSMYGDKLNQKRTIILDTNKEQKRMFGFEVGKLKMSYRVVTPIFHNNKHIGLVEVGILPEKFTNNLSQLFNIKNALVVKSDKISVSLKKKNYLQKNDFSLISDDNMMKKIFIKAIDNNSHSFQFVDTKNNKHYVVENNLNLLDHKKQIYAKILLAHDTTQFQQRYDEFVQETALVAIVIFMVLFFLLNTSFNYYIQEISKSEKELLNLNKSLEHKVNEKTKELRELNDNLENKVQDEIQKNKDKEKILFQQSKMASMGEMIGNIAHQWRQPLNEISTGASSIKVKKEYDMPLDDSELLETMNTVINSTQHLSKTIDDFRNFFQPDKEKSIFSVKEAIEKDLQLVSASFKNKDIRIILDLHNNTQVCGYQNELTQALLNILTNARDILIKLDSDKRLILINSYKENNKAKIVIKDSGGGINSDIIDKVFEPYFTTKHQSQGTGIGLYMTHQIIVGHMDGEISVKNDKYTFENIDYEGAEFTITLPLNNDK